MRDGPGCVNQKRQYGWFHHLNDRAELARALFQRAKVVTAVRIWIELIGVDFEKEVEEKIIGGIVSLILWLGLAPNAARVNCCTRVLNLSFFLFSFMCYFIFLLLISGEG